MKVNPDKPQEHARFLTLEAHKTLLVPTPRLRTGLFNRIVPPSNPNKEDLRKCSTSQGVKQFSIPIGLDCKIIVDIVIIGSVAVTRKGLSQTVHLNRVTITNNYENISLKCRVILFETAWLYNQNE